MAEKIEEKFPYYYHEASKLSIKSQNRYIGLFKWSLILLISALSLSCCLPLIKSSSFLRVYSTAIVFLILLSALFTWIVHNSNLQKKWYDGRAIAESIKTMSWKFINSVHPYDQKESENIYIKDIKDILKKHGGVSKLLTLSITEGNTIITDEMQSFKALPEEKRKEVYLAQRIQNQINWYTNKAQENSRDKNIWFYTAFSFQLLAIVAVIILFLNSDLAVNFVGLFVTISTSLISWIQVKRYQELIEAYSVTAMELEFIYDRGIRIKESDLPNFIGDAEKAISREHTLWIARRDHSTFKDINHP
ncbi:DUF4231 domain-containing protein [Alkalihalobacillus hwajinpoensis]|uniref:DUF4231 domain-containing protein n=1 Tax=Guptibacillus hwajinpoensis TaxID=208199 RepID=UPI00188419DA|nr:DUF4231 domain-containing protein [Pseudalkalibacillus hwajinpoensis]MBF0706024.1 DUF4231 domain-containing protein [Pseudalkalibacillus hwajinpoensis]